MPFLKHNIMRQSGKLSILIFMTIFPALGTIYGQEVFRGIVVDSASMAALPSVNIQVKNATAGTTTDENGSFSLRALATDTLVFSLVGYQRLELPLAGYEAGVIRLSEKYTMLKAVTIDEYRRENLYEGMFEDQNARLKRSIPFYLSKAKKEKIRLQGLKEENLRVQTYVEVVVNDPGFKSSFKMKYGLNEDEYYRILTAFNETHYRVMYYLTRAELLSLLNTFFENQALQR
ncbi:MAG TPA: carboxypeptidase-like regulatory domain-containing protein [Chryseosolibacter sp.]|nr:carboxypeptidase-like regulatory domain-containing protein [Chryseosolibacter sp.]